MHHIISETRIRSAILSLSFFLLLFANVNAQRSPIIIAGSVADKIINDSVFEFEMFPQARYSGIRLINFEQVFSGKENSVGYALSYLNSDADTTVSFGFTSTGKTKVWVNDSLIFSQYEARSAEITEIAYDRFLFRDTLRIHLSNGRNKLLVKSVSQPREWFTLMAVLNKQGLSEPSVKFSVQDSMFNLSGESWVYMGPFPFSGPNRPQEILNFTLPPERKILPFYEFNKKIYSWKIRGSRAAPQLKIKETAAFRKDSYLDWHYANGETMLGILAVARASGDRKYHDFVKKFCDFTLANADYFRWQYDSLHILRGSYHRLFRRSMLDDTGGPALPFLELYDEASGNNWRELVLATAEFVSRKQVRLSDGTLCRPEPEAMTVWADDMFMSVPFMLRMGKISGDRTWYDDAVRQIINFTRYLRDPQTGLFYHGWFSATDKNAGVFWGRANGWVAWALSEALLSLPDQHPEYEKVLKIYRNFMKTLITFQDNSGMWHQVLDHPESYPETSCSAMFVLALARGVNQGWLNRDFREAAEKGWAGIRTKIDSSGVVHGICRGTGIGPDLNYYMKRPTFDNDPRGLGAVMTAAAEVSAFTQK